MAKIIITEMVFVHFEKRKKKKKKIHLPQNSLLLNKTVKFTWSPLLLTHNTTDIKRD